MNPVALVLALAAAGFHAGWNRLLHDVEDRVPVMAIAGLTGCLLLLPAIAAAPPTRVAWSAVLSALAETGYILCLSAAYRRGALSLAYPIARGTAPFLVTLGGWVVLAQPVKSLTLLGAVSLGLGLSLVAAAGAGPARSSAIAYALLTGCFIASYSLIDAQAVQHVNAAAYLGAVFGLQGMLLVAVRPDRPGLRRALGPGILIGVGGVGAYLLVLLAFQRAPAGQVATVRETSVLLALLIARDRPHLTTWLGGGLVVVGAALAAL